MGEEEDEEEEEEEGEEDEEEEEEGEEEEVEDERHRGEVDAAKKRAVGQLSDYDTFRNMVSVAHLRPLQADDRVDRGAAAAAWSFDGAGRAVAEAAPGAGGAASTEATAPSGDAGGALPDEPPRNRDEFLAAWRRARG